MYQELISKKVIKADSFGFEVNPDDLHPSLFPHQRDAVLWMLKGGRRAGFLSFGLGKTRINLEIQRQCHLRDGGKVLFITTLGVRAEFTRNDGPAMGMDLQYCRNMAVKKRRKGFATELNGDYWKDGGHYLRSAELELNVPTLFDCVC